MKILNLMALLSFIPNCFSSMTIINRTPYTLYVTLDQVSTLYHEKLEPCYIMHRNTGAVHFTITVTVVDDNFKVPSDGEIVGRHFGNIFKFLAKAVEKGEGIGVRGEKLLVGGIIQTVETLMNLPSNNLELSDAGWYAGKNHIITIWGGVDSRLVLYSCRNQEYFPYRGYDYVKGKAVCGRYEDYVDYSSGRYYSYCEAEETKNENERRRIWDEL